ncbi:MAG: rRNA adenine N-6-methyltransferase family protein, partial [Pseudomonadota bacterium]|nr:rRNA adenine N-6-methyltransferase family protein [Pseudomonadota bacterium]
MTVADDPTLERIASLPPLRAVIAAHQLSARKQLGQNFLLDLNLTRRIARAAGRLDQGTVIEIGPGPGGLTRALLMEGARHLVAIEKDARAVGALAELVAAAEGLLTLRHGDASALTLVDLGPPPRRVVAN